MAYVGVLPGSLARPQVKFGLPTLTAAAAGQMVSDSAGVVFGNSIEVMTRHREEGGPVHPTSSIQYSISKWTPCHQTRR